jgi:hypothetical protein
MRSTVILSLPFLATSLNKTEIKITCTNSTRKREKYRIILILIYIDNKGLVGPGTRQISVPGLFIALFIRSATNVSPLSLYVLPLLAYRTLCKR